MFGKLTAEQIEEVLQTQFLGHLACHADDQTYLIPISYAYENSSLYVHSEDGLKIKMMRKNPKVCIQVDERQDMSNWRSVIGWGQFSEITNEDERNKALQLLVNRQLPILSSSTTHLGSNWPFSSTDVTVIPGIVFKITLDKKTGRFEENKVSPQFAG
ncbi:MAG TPA: pyridoxamine 5'-phosphate oxidase family protein [Flavisolibacter sp.]|nr:pyridoxamine 5'-phosphate oxidase family protein [Flavisolibacter sp.]